MRDFKNVPDQVWGRIACYLEIATDNKQMVEKNEEDHLRERKNIVEDRSGRDFEYAWQGSEVWKRFC